jgi:hypothetical protein
MARLGVVGSRGMGAHARARVLASQGRGVAVPCAGHRHPGPAARRGSGRATAVAGETAARWGPAQKTARLPEGKWGSLGLAIEGSSASLAAEGKKKGRRRWRSSRVRWWVTWRGGGLVQAGRGRAG